MRAALMAARTGLCARWHALAAGGRLARLTRRGGSREAEESVASLLYHGEYNALFSSPQRLLLGGELAWVEPQVWALPFLKNG